MQSKPCPTCNGTGTVWVTPHFKTATSTDKRWDNAGKTCHCDGPAHGYSPGWCPDKGPVDET